MDTEESPPLSLCGSARAFAKAPTEGSGVPAFVLNAITQVGSPSAGFVFLQKLVQGALDER